MHHHPTKIIRVENSFKIILKNKLQVNQKLTVPDEYRDKPLSPLKRLERLLSSIMELPDKTPPDAPCACTRAKRSDSLIRPPKSDDPPNEDDPKLLEPKPEE